MLLDVVNNKENFRLLLIEDSVNQSGRGLLNALIHQLATRVDEVHYICCDFPPEIVASHLDNDVRRKIIFHDLYSDPLGWNGGKLTLETNIPTVLSQNVNPGVETVTIVLDSLSPLLLHRTPQYTCQTINSLAFRNFKKGVTVKNVVCLVHGDLHDSSTVTLLEHTATTILVISPPEHPNFSGTCSLTQKKGSGKITKKKEYYTLNESCQLLHCQEASTITAVDKTNRESKESDPAANLTFNLRLTSNEKEARSQVKLPYTYQEDRKEKLLNAQETGKIFYHPDKEDDFDEDDPDDDLDI